MSYLYEKSSAWRWVVASGKGSKPFFYAFATLCFLFPVGVGYATMQVTSLNNERLEKELSKTGRNDATVMARVNKERLAQLLGEIQRKEDMNDRYVAALRGEILTGTPGNRIRGQHGGTSMPQVQDGGSNPPLKS